MLGKEQNWHTFEEYLILEEKATYKSEYQQGYIIAIAGASLAHNRIVGNLRAAFQGLGEKNGT